MIERAKENFNLLLSLNPMFIVTSYKTTRLSYTFAQLRQKTIKKKTKCEQFQKITLFLVEFTHRKLFLFILLF